MKWSREKRKQRQQVATLLIEPTADQENETNRRASESLWQKSISDNSNDKCKSKALNQNSNDHQNFKSINDSNKRNVINSADDWRQSKYRSSAKSKSELTSMLVILFGPLLLVYLLNGRALCTQQPNKKLNLTLQNGLNSLNDEANTKPLVLRNATHVESLMTTPPPLPATSLMMSSSDDANESPSILNGEPADDIDLGEESDGNSNSNNNDSGDETAGKLTNVILGAASDGADLLVKKLRPPEVGGDDSSDDSESGAEEKTGSDQAKPPADPEVKPAAKQESREQASTTSHQLNRTAKHQAEMAAELKLAMETYAKWRHVGDDIIELFSRKLLPVIVEHGYDVDAGTVSGLLQVFNGIRGLKPWAMKLLDASAKLAPGVLIGTQSDFGDYDECINIRVDDPSGLVAGNPELMGELDPETGLYSSTLVGKYCLADIEFPKPPRHRLAHRNEELQTDFAPIELRRPLLNFSETAAFKETIFVETGNFFHMLYVDPLRVGICLTNKIDADNFATVFNKLIEEFKVKIDFKGRCVTKYDKVTWSVQQVVSAYVILTACALVCLCTLLDLLHMKLNKLPMPKRFSEWKCKFRLTLFKYRPLFTSFSIIRNTKRLFKPQQQQQQQQAARNKISSPSCATSNGVQVNGQAKSLDQLMLANGINGLLGPRPAAAANGSTSTSSLAADSSVESSPCIERRSSSVTGSAMNLISSSSDSASMVTTNSVAVSHGGAKYLSSYSRSASISAATSDHQVDQPQRQVNLMCLHGIRVITMTWMIVNHTYLFGGFFVLWAHRRLIDIAEWPKSISFQLVLNGWLTVETYFFLGATIIVLNVMPLMRKRKFSYLSYIFHRLLRLLPAYVGLVCLNFLWPLVSSGPVWLVKGKSFIQTPCENYLWTNFLFINNWIWPEKQCMVHTWFLSADFQLYLLAPLIVYFLYRRPVFGHSLNLIVAIVASVLSGLVIYANKLMPTTLINKLEFDSIKQQLSYSYFATYQHMGPYCLGILTGYMLHKCPQVRLPKHLTWSLWLLLPPLSFTTLLLTYLWNGAYDDPSLINPSPLVSALYVAIHRTIWTSLVAWIVFACATGRAKLMSSFLSHSMFVPLSRLSFSIYLVHLPVIMFRALNLRHTVEWTDSNILWEACGNFIISIMVGYFVNITFESPIINLEHVVFGRPESSTSSTSSSSEGDLYSKQYKSNLAQQAMANSNKQQVSLASSAERMHRQPTNSTLSALDSDNKSDTNHSSASTVDRLPESSPEQERKLSSSADRLLLNSISSSSGHNNGLDDNLAPKSSIWPTGEQVAPSNVVGRYQDQRRSLRPMRVGSNFSLGNQMEPPPGGRRASLFPTGDDDDIGGPSRLSEQMGQQVVVAAAAAARGGDTRVPFNRKFLSQQEQAAMSAEFKHYARGGYQHWRMGARPMQYATLASGNSRRSQMDNRYHEFGYPNYYDTTNELANYRRPKASGSLMSEPATASRAYDLDSAHDTDHQSIGAKNLLADARQQIFSVQQQQQHQQPPMSQYQPTNSLMQARKRPGRYNTLTGIGSREWRTNMRSTSQEEDDYLPRNNQNEDDSVTWRRFGQTTGGRPTDEHNPSTSSSSSSGMSIDVAQAANNWMQQTGGVMIPRVDSSTLRRNMKRAEPQPASSILEEPNFLEDEPQEASAL